MFSEYLYKMIHTAYFSPRTVWLQIFMNYLIYTSVFSPYAVIRKRVKSRLSRHINKMKTSRAIRRVCTHEEPDFSETVRGYQFRNQEIRQGLKVSALPQKLEKIPLQWLGPVLCMVDNNIHSTKYVEYTTTWAYQVKWVNCIKWRRESVECSNIRERQ